MTGSARSSLACAGAARDRADRCSRWRTAKSSPSRSIRSIPRSRRWSLRMPLFVLIFVLPDSGVLHRRFRRLAAAGPTSPGVARPDGRHRRGLRREIEILNTRARRPQARIARRAARLAYRVLVAAARDVTCALLPPTT